MRLRDADRPSLIETQSEEVLAMRGALLLLAAAITGCRSPHPAQPEPAAEAKLQMMFDDGTAIGIDVNWRVRA